MEIEEEKETLAAVPPSSLASKGCTSSQWIVNASKHGFKGLILQVKGWQPTPAQCKSQLSNYRACPSATILPFVNTEGIWKSVKFDPVKSKWGWTLDMKFVMASGLSMEEWKSMLQQTEQMTPTLLCLCIVEQYAPAKAHPEFKKWVQQLHKHEKPDFIKVRYPAMYQYLQKYQTEAKEGTTMEGVLFELIQMPESEHTQAGAAFLEEVVQHQQVSQQTTSFQWTHLLEYADQQHKEEMVTLLKKHPWTFQQFEPFQQKAGTAPSLPVETWKTSILENGEVQDVWIVHVDLVDHPSLDCPTHELFLDVGTTKEWKKWAWWPHVVVAQETSLHAEWTGVVVPRGWMGRKMLLLMHQKHSPTSFKQTHLVSTQAKKWWRPLQACPPDSAAHTSLERVLPLRVLETLHKTHLLTTCVQTVTVDESSVPRLETETQVNEPMEEEKREEQKEHLELSFEPIQRSLVTLLGHVDASFHDWCTLFCKTWIESGRRLDLFFMTCSFIRLWSSALLFWTPTEPWHRILVQCIHRFVLLGYEAKGVVVDMQAPPQSIEGLDLFAEREEDEEEEEKEEKEDEESEEEGEEASKKGKKVSRSILRANHHIRHRWSWSQLVGELQGLTVSPLEHQQRVWLWLLLEREGETHPASLHWMVYVAAQWKWARRRVSSKVPIPPLVGYTLQQADRVLYLPAEVRCHPPSMKYWKAEEVVLQVPREGQSQVRWLRPEDWDCGVPLEQRELPFFPAAYAAMHLQVEHRHASSWVLQVWKRNVNRNGFDALRQQATFADPYRALMYRFLIGETKRLYLEAPMPGDVKDWNGMAPLLSPYTDEAEVEATAGHPLFVQRPLDEEMGSNWKGRTMFRIQPLRLPKAQDIPLLTPHEEEVPSPQDMAIQVLEYYFYSMVEFEGVRVYRDTYPYPTEPAAFVIVCDFGKGGLHLRVPWKEWTEVIQPLTVIGDVQKEPMASRIHDLWESMEEMESVEQQLRLVGQVHLHWAFWLQHIIKTFFQMKSQLRLTSVPFRSGWKVGWPRGILMQVPILVSKESVEVDAIITLWDPRYHGLSKAQLKEKTPWCVLPLVAMRAATFKHHMDLSLLEPLVPLYVPPKHAPWSMAEQEQKSVQWCRVYWAKNASVEKMTRFRRQHPSYKEPPDGGTQMGMRTVTSSGDLPFLSFAGVPHLRDTAWWDSLAEFFTARFSHVTLLHALTQAILYPYLLVQCQLPNIHALTSVANRIWMPMVVPMEGDVSEDTHRARQQLQILLMMEVEQFLLFLVKVGLLDYVEDTHTYTSTAGAVEEWVHDVEGKLSNPLIPCTEFQALMDDIQQQPNIPRIVRELQLQTSPSVYLWEWSYFFSRCHVIWRQRKEEVKLKQRVDAYIHQTGKETNADVKHEEAALAQPYETLDKANRVYWSPRKLHMFLHAWLTIAATRSPEEHAHLRFAILLLLQTLPPTQVEQWTWKWTSKSISPSQLKRFPFLPGYILVVWHWIMMSTGGVFHRTTTSRSGLLDVCHWECSLRVPDLYMDLLKQVLGQCISQTLEPAKRIKSMKMAQEKVQGRWEPLCEGIADTEGWTIDQCIAEIGAPRQDVQGIERTMAARIRLMEQSLQGRVLAPWQKSGLQKMSRDLMRYRGQLLGDSMGCGKCWGIGTKLMMFDGTVKKVEDIKENDELMGDDSTPRVVQPNSLIRETGKMFQIQSNSAGRSTWTCNEDHILVLRINLKPYPHRRVRRPHGEIYWEVVGWVLNTHTDGYVYPGRQRIIPTLFPQEEDAKVAATTSGWKPLEFEISVKNFMKLHKDTRRCCVMFQPEITTFKSALRSFRSRVIQYWNLQDEKDDILEKKITETAWVVGMWFTDGTTKTTTISQIKDKRQKMEQSHTPVVERLEQWFYLMHPGEKSDLIVPNHLTSAGNRVYSIQLAPTVNQFPDVSKFIRNKLKLLLESYNMYHHKQLPIELMSNNIEIRKHLLGGIIDGNGWIQWDNHHKEYGLVSARLDILHSVTILCRSLGFRVGTVTTNHKHLDVTGKDYINYSITITGPIYDLSSYITLLYKKCPSNEELGREPNKDSNCDGFTITELPEPAEYVGFTLDGNGRCLLDDFLVTHNTIQLQLLALADSIKMGLNLILTPVPITHIQELLLPEVYGSQISFYVHDPKHPQHVLNGVREPLDTVFTETSQLLGKGYRFVIVSYDTLESAWTTLGSDHFFWNIPWNFVLCDECTVLRKPTTILFQAVKALFSKKRIAASGTPYETAASNIWTILELLECYLSLQPDWRRYWGALFLHSLLQRMMVRREKEHLLSCQKESLRMYIPLNPVEYQFQKLLQVVRNDLNAYHPDLQLSLGQLLILGCSAPWIWLPQSGFKIPQAVAQALRVQLERVVHGYLNLDQVAPLKFNHHAYTEVLAQSSLKETSLVVEGSIKAFSTKLSTLWIQEFYQLLTQVADASQQSPFSLVSSQPIWTHPSVHTSSTLKYLFQECTKLSFLKNLIAHLILHLRIRLDQWTEEMTLASWAKLQPLEGLKLTGLKTLLTPEEQALVERWYVSWMFRRARLRAEQPLQFEYEEMHGGPTTLKEADAKHMYTPTFLRGSTLQDTHFFMDPAIPVTVQDVERLMRRGWLDPMEDTPWPLEPFKACARLWKDNDEHEITMARADAVLGNTPTPVYPPPLDDEAYTRMWMALYQYTLQSKEPHPAFERPEWQEALKKAKRWKLKKPLGWRETKAWKAWMQTHLLQEPVFSMSPSVLPVTMHTRPMHAHQKLVVFIGNDRVLSFVTRTLQPYLLQHRISFAVANRDTSYGTFFHSTSVAQLKATASSWTHISKDTVVMRSPDTPVWEWMGTQDMARDALQFCTETQLLFISTCSKLGVNLSAASNLCMYELDTNPAINWQIEDRIHRMSQQAPTVYIYKPETQCPDASPTYEHSRVLSLYIREAEIIKTVGTQAQLQYKGKKLLKWSREENMQELLMECDPILEHMSLKGTRPKRRHEKKQKEEDPPEKEEKEEDGLDTSASPLESDWTLQGTGTDPGEVSPSVPSGTQKKIRLQKNVLSSGKR